MVQGLKVPAGNTGSIPGLEAPHAGQLTCLLPLLSLLHEQALQQEKHRREKPSLQGLEEPLLTAAHGLQPRSERGQN